MTEPVKWGGNQWRPEIPTVVVERYIGIAEIEAILSGILGNRPHMWRFLVGRDALAIAIPGRTIEVEGPGSRAAIAEACYRLLGNSASVRLVPENAAEYEAAANGRRLL